MSECVLKTLACRGLRVGPSKCAIGVGGGYLELTTSRKSSRELQGKMYKVLTKVPHENANLTVLSKVYIRWSGRGSSAPFHLFCSFSRKILAVWILAAKLPNFYFSFGFIFVLFFQGKKPNNVTKKSTAKSTRDFFSEKFPSDFCRNIFLIFLPLL